MSQQRLVQDPENITGIKTGLYKDQNRCSNNTSLNVQAKLKCFPANLLVVFFFFFGGEVLVEGTTQGTVPRVGPHRSQARGGWNQLLSNRCLGEMGRVLCTKSPSEHMECFQQ